MFSTLPGYVVGYHGTSKAIGTEVIHGLGGRHLRPSTQDYEWLGEAVYFWENSVARAEEWALSKHPGEGAVVGAVLQLGTCLDLLDQTYINIVEAAARNMVDEMERAGKPIPANSKRGAYRFDCALIEYIKSSKGRYGNFDSARAAYIEGDPIVGRSEFRRNTHIQIAVFNLNCIKGYFWPVEDSLLTSSVGASI